MSHESGQIIGLVIQRAYPDQDRVRQTLLGHPSALWVYAETDLEARKLVDPDRSIALGLNPHWRGDTYDLRRIWRDCEILHLCSRVYVFQKETAKNQWATWHASGLHPHVVMGGIPSSGLTVTAR